MKRSVALDVRCPIRSDTHPDGELQMKRGLFFVGFVSRRLFRYECEWGVGPPSWPRAGLDARLRVLSDQCV